MSLLRITKSKYHYFAYFAVALVLLGVLFVGWQLMQRAQAAGGTFELTIEPQKTSVQSGEETVYVIKYSCSGQNAGDSCDAITLRANRPTINGAGAQPTPVTVAGNSQTTSNRFVNNNAEWTFINTIPAGSSGQLTASWRPANGTTPNGATMNLQVTAASAGTTVATQTNNTVTVQSAADYTITKTPSKDNRIVIGYEYTYTINLGRRVFTQQGLLDLQNVVVTDTLPQDAEYIRSDNGGVYDAATNTVTWPSIANVGNSTISRKVTVRYDAPIFTVGQQVTNNVSFIGNEYGNSEKKVSGNGSVTNQLSDTPTLQTNYYKGAPDGVAVDGQQQISPGGRATWRFVLFQTSNTPISGTITDVLPCRDTLGNPKVSPSDPSTPCANPATITEDIRWSPRDVLLKQIRWWANTGATGTYTVPSPGASTAMQTITPNDLGVPAGQKITALQVSYEQNDMLNSTGGSIFINGTADAQLQAGDSIQNVANYEATNGRETKTGSLTATYRIAQQLPRLFTDISDVAGTGVAYQPGRTITWNVRYTNNDGGNIDYQAPATPELYLAIPKGLRFIPGSITYTDLANVGGSRPTLVEAKPGVGNLSGYTVLHLRWPDTAKLDYTNKSIQFRLETLVEPGQPQGTFNGSPPNAGQAPATNSRAIVATGYAAGLSTTRSFGSDAADYDGDGDTSERIYITLTPWTVNLAAVAFADTLVKGENEAEYSMLGRTLPGKAGSFRMKLQNASNDGSRLNNMIFYATLPKPGDKYVSEGLKDNNRGSTTSAVLSGPAEVPADVIVEYSLAANPCRDEVYSNSSNTGCVDDWATTVSDWSKVTAVRFKLTKTYAPTEGEQVVLPVLVADTAKDGDIAYLSTAYRANNADSGQSLLPAETPRVGLQVVDPTLTTRKTANPATGSEVAPSNTITYTIATRNTSSVDGTDVTTTIRDDLTTVLTKGQLVPGSLRATSEQRGTQTAPTINGTELRWQGMIAEGDTITLTYQVKLNSQVTSGTIDNRVVASGSLDDTTVTTNCQTGQESGCRTTHNLIAPEPNWRVAKTNDKPNQALKPGDKLGYTITLHNNGKVTLENVRASDDLGSVLAASTLDMDSLTATSSSGQAVADPAVTDQKLSWQGRLAVNETVTLRYTVTIMADSWKKTFNNAVVAQATHLDQPVISPCATGQESGCRVANRVVTQGQEPPNPDTPDVNGGITNPKAPDTGVAALVKSVIINPFMVIAAWLSIVVAIGGLVYGIRRWRQSV